MERTEPLDPQSSWSADRKLMREGRVHATWVGLASGSYRLSVLDPDFEEAVAEVQDVPVRAGSDALDPRLHGIDLRDAVRRVTLRILSPGGGPVAEGVVYVRTQSGSRSYPIEEGQVDLVTTRPVEGLVHAPGLEAQPFADLFSDREVTLAPRIQLGLRIPNWRPLPEGVTAVLRVAMASSGEAFPLHIPPDDSTPVDSSGEARVELSIPGVKRVHLRLENPRGSVSVVLLGDLDLGHPRPSEVVELKMDPAALAEALVRLKE
jgi:hypothetical protein